MLSHKNVRCEIISRSGLKFSPALYTHL
jgi:hypothetical protein